MGAGTRRQFLRRSAAGAMLAGGPLTFLWSRRTRADGYGELVPDPAGILDLPEGFTYRILERAGDPMGDGYRVPGLPDGMACVELVGGDLALMRNHELLPTDSALSPYAGGQAIAPQAYDPASLGGVTRLVLDPETFERKSSNLVLVGTDRNCAGGMGPGGWLSCEETTAAGHGYVFLCRPEASTVRAPVRLPILGRFRHEAAAWDPASGIVYLTEDQPDGCLYRMVPDVSGEPYQGRLQALRIADVDGVDTGPEIDRGKILPCGWVDIQVPDPAEDTVRFEAHARGAAIFVRGEGLWWEDGALYVVSTTGGAAAGGQIFRHVPGPTPAEGGTLELLAEAGGGTDMANPDNIVMAPWGDLYFAEDNLTVNYLQVLDREGQVHRFARNALSNSELAGVCFSPDGRALFCNIWSDGITLVITGPFDGADPLPPGDTGKAPTDTAPPLDLVATAECACTTVEPDAARAGALAATAVALGLRPTRPR